MSESWSAGVRGQVLRLKPHPEHCSTGEEFLDHCRSLRARDDAALLGADLFSGAGGMSLGLEAAGIKMVFGADFDPDARETHAHHFGGMSVAWDLGDPACVAEVGRLLRSARIDVLAGGPPCQPFSKAGRSGMRHLVREGVRDPYDQRRDLWQSYLEIVRLARPRAVIMENVPDMALDREMFILRSIVQRLEDWGYSVQERVVDTYRYGVPQFRQRLILVAMLGKAHFDWPAETTKKVTLGNAISDLPPVDPQAGWTADAERGNWRPYHVPRTAFQRAMRATVPSSDKNKVFDHVTRRVRADDAEAFDHLGTKTRYSELPDELKRYRDDIFDDKYKRLDANDLCRTITAHIAKDGYWYIHPEQNRTLTVREAARVQTFPDHFRFAGPPTSALRQIGNAVPPELARAVGAQVARTLAGGGQRAAVTSRETRGALANWFDGTAHWIDPWLKVDSRWLVILGEELLGQETERVVRSIWPIAKRWGTPEALLAATTELGEVCGWLDKPGVADALVGLAESVVDGSADLHDDDLAVLVASGRVSRVSAELAMLVESEGEEPVLATTGALRVAGRFFQGTERWLRNRNSDGRIAVARLVGFSGASRRAQLGLIVLGTTVCTPRSPSCAECPLVRWCQYAADRAAEVAGSP